MRCVHVIGVSALLVSISSTYNVPDNGARLRRTSYYRCRDPGLPVNGFSWFTSRRTGAVVVHSCKPGFVLFGPRLRVCQANGRWSLSLPRCASSECEDPPSPDNALRILSSTAVNSVVKYKCNRGYKLIGSAYRVCRANGKWSGVPARCVGGGCGELSNPDNGRVEVSSNKVGGVATYSCNDGYRLVGDDTRVCKDSGSWDGTMPSCEAVSCGSLSDIANGKVVVSGTTPGSLATYSCNTGFVLVGGSVRKCGNNGDWSGKEPFCRKVHVSCESLVAPDNGFIVFQPPSTPQSPGDSAIYQCNQGFTLVGGDKKRVCQANGRYSGVAPSCQALRCPNLRDPVNGRVSLSGNGVGDEAVYRCSRGFMLVGKKKRRCGSDGAWSGVEPTCRPVDCGGLSDPLFGRVFITTTKFAGAAKYSCNDGYMLVGVALRRCMANGVWSDEAPTCSASSCGPLSSPANGIVTITGSNVGDIATYVCNRGFRLVGQSVRSCLSGARWSGTAPTCSAVVCEALRDIANGRVSVSGSTPGAIATYTCNEGFMLVGQATRNCQQDGSYSGREPVCREIDCGALSDPSNGVVQFSSTTVSSIARYICNIGYSINGASERVCEANGQWSPAAPTCIIVDCGRLLAPANGAIDFTSTTYLAKTVYSCNPGYQLVGATTRICQANGQWSQSAPTCRGNRCAVLTDPANGIVKFGSTNVRATATYVCNKGFVLVGSAVRVCQQDGEWSGEEPICRVVECEVLLAPANGRVGVPSNRFGSVAVYFCDDNFELDGDKSRTCQFNGQWSGTMPFCRRIDCGVLEPPSNGLVRVTGTDVGSIATYSCVNEYQLSGPGTRECLASGRWSGTEPQCISIGCGTLFDPLDGRVEFSGTNVESRATYFCNDGFELVGDRFRICKRNGEWSGTEPTCSYIAIDCGDLEAPPNGSVELSGTSPDSIATYSCNFGFVLDGTLVRVCLETGQWSLKEPSCRAVDCGPLNAPTNGDVRVSETTFGATARYSCSFGYQLVGLSVRVCEISGQWSGNAPVCQVSECERLPDIANGHVVLSGTSVGSTATYSCATGFELVGKSVRRCRNDGSWSLEEPFCKVIDCGPLFAPDNGQVEFADTIFGSTATYQCNEGFSIQGPSQRSCLGDGQWSEREPLCIRKEAECGPLSDPHEGLVLVAGTTQGSTATYICNHGYIIAGDDIRYCGGDGVWSGSDPICRPIDCGPVDPPIYGDIQFIGNGFGAIVRYSCRPGYVMVGVASRTCQSDGFWSGQAPVCVEDEPSPPSGCGDPGTPANGFKEGVDYNIGSIVYYTCSDGYRLVGLSSLLCQFNGRWSGNVPQCISDQSCVEGFKVEDECGRLCLCEGGRLVKCCRQRKDYASLTDEEKQRYLDAVMTVSSSPRYQSQYYDLLDQYQRTHGTVAQGSNHKTSQFFVWNRYYLLQYENLLREVDCRITIPYYDWSVLPQHPYRSVVWTDDLGFGRSSRSSDYCVDSGRFSYDKYQLIPSAGGGCLKREYKDEIFPSRTLIDRDILTLPANYFDEFHRTLHLFVHSNIRCFIGGTMCTSDAANDPVFVPHLAMVDYILDRWQRLNVENLRVRYYDDQTALVLTPEHKVTDYHDNDNLPGGEAVCYTEPSTKSHFIPGGYSLAALSTPAKIEMNCLSSSALTSLQLDDEAVNLMNECN